MAKRGKSSTESAFVGPWRLLSMSIWGDRPIDQVEPRELEFHTASRGRFEIGAVGGDIDYRESARDGLPGLEFSWEGDVDGVPACGRGWAVLDGARLRGMFFLHNGEDSSFEARRAEPGETAVRPVLTLLGPGAVGQSWESEATPARPQLQPAGSLFQLKVTLRGVRPPIWRRLLVPDCTLHRLHDILQDAMGWTDSHLHQFDVGGEQFSSNDSLLASDDMFFRDDVLDSGRVSLSQLVPRESFKFRYEYDFGDGWEHDILVEKILPPDPAREHPECLKGKRACPPEDVGGTWGYAEFAEAILDPRHERHGELLEWNGPFDPEAFDLAEVNARLRGDG